MKKIFSVILIVLISIMFIPNIKAESVPLPDFSNPPTYTDTDSVLNAKLSTDYFPYDSRSRAISLIGEGGSAFLISGDSFFVKGGKYSYPTFDWNPYLEKGIFMAPAPLVAAAYDIALSRSGNTYTLGTAVIYPDNTAFNLSGESLTFSASPKIINDILYIPLEDTLKYICKMHTYNDGRMILASSSEITLTNSKSSEKILEPIDVIYRFLMFERPDGDEVYGDIDTALRPKILTTPQKLSDTKNRINSGTDALVIYWYNLLLSGANALLDADFPEYTVVSGSLTDCARRVLSNIVTLSAAYLLTDNPVYAERCHAEMLNALNWNEWNAHEVEENGKMRFSGHYLGVSELTRAMAIGFDSLYSYLDKDEKVFIIEKTIEHSLSYALKCYKITQYDYYQGSEWRYAEGNWGAVCPSSIISACISFAGEENTWLYENSAYLLGEAIHSLEFPLMLFYPDGAWYEGLSYWGYAADYLFGGGISPLYNATGKTYSLLKPEGVSETLYSVMYLQTAENGIYNYADASEKTLLHAIGFLICDLLDDNALTNSWLEFLKNSKSSGGAISLLRYHPEAEESSAPMPTDRYFKSAEVGVMKSSWQRGGTYVGIKGGQNNTNHDNLDLGSFIFENGGVRWAAELGSDDYFIEGGYWGPSGYQLYVKRPEGQNCLVINPREDTEEMYGGQYLNAYAPLIKSDSGDRAAYMVLDLSDAYKYDTSEYIRGYYLGDDRNTLTVKDEFTLLEDESKIYWFMHTKAEITVSADGKSATLTDDSGKELTVSAKLSDTVSDWHFEKREIAPFESSPQREGQLQGEYSKSEFSKLTLVASGSGEVEISVKLMSSEQSFQSASLEKIDNWTIPEGYRENMVSFLSVYDGAKISGGTTDISAKIDRGFESAALLINGKVISEISDGNSGTYEFTLPKDAFRNLEECTLSVSLDNTSPCAETKVYISEIVDKTSFFDVVDFENCLTDYTIETIASQCDIEIQIGESATGIIYSKNENNSFSITTDGSKNSHIRKSLRADSGVIEVEFDASVSDYGGLISFEPKLTSTAADRNFYFDNGYSTTTIFGNKLLGNSLIYIVPGRVYHISIVLDLTLGRYMVYAADDIALTEKTLISSGTIKSYDPENVPLNLSYFRINFRNYNGDTGKKVSWNIDNISACNPAYSPALPKVSQVSFEKAGTLSSAKFYVFPMDADKIAIKLDTPLDSESVTDENILFYCGDKLQEYSSVSLCDNKTIILSGLGEILPHKAYRVVLGKNLKNENKIPFSRELDINMLSGDKNSLYLSSAIKTENGNITATIYGKNAGDKDVTIDFAALALYSQNKLIDFKALSDKTFAAGIESEKTIPLSATGADSAKLFVWDSLLSPVLKLH